MILVHELGEEMDGASPVQVGQPQHHCRRRQQQLQVCSEGACLSPVVPLRVGSHHRQDLLEKQEGTSYLAGGGAGNSESHAEIAARFGPLFPCSVSSFTAVTRRQMGVGGMV